MLTVTRYPGRYGPRARHCAGAVLVLMTLLSSSRAGSGSEAEGGIRSPQIITLSDCMNYAGAGSLEFRQAGERLRAAGVAYDDTKAMYWPKVALAVDYVYKDSYNPGEPDPTRPYLSFSQASVNDWEKVEKTKTAIGNLYAAKLSYEKLRRFHLGLAGEKYFALLAAQKLLGRAQSGIDQKRRSLEEVEKKVRLGLAPRIDALRAKTSLIRSTVEFHAREGALKKARLDLVATLGLPRGTLPVADEDIDLGDLPPQTACQEIAVLNSPEMKIQREALDELKELSKATKWTRWPRASAQAFFGYNPGDINQETDFSIIFTLSQTIFDGGTTRRRIEASGIEVRSQGIAIEKLKKEIADSIELLFSELDSTDRVLAEAREQQIATEQLVELSKKGYELNVASLKDLLDAQSLAEEQATVLAITLANRRAIELKIHLLTGSFQERSSGETGKESFIPASRSDTAGTRAGTVDR